MGKRTPTGTCRLCLCERPLSRSHILPEFLYSKTPDEDGVMISITSNPLHRPRRVQTGSWEHLLCSDCEGMLADYERYAADVLKQADAVPTEGVLGARLDYDYRRFKVFGLSLIWRSHVARRWEYRRFSVGPLGEELRLKIKAGDPGPPEFFPFVASRFIGSETAQRSMTTPTIVKRDGHRFALFDIYGFTWMFVTSRRSHAIPKALPLVGYTEKLIVPFIPTTDRQALRTIKERLPAHIWDRIRANKQDAT